MSRPWSPSAGQAYGDAAVRIIGWLRRLDVDSLAEVCRARAEVPQRSPETIGDLARLLSDPESVAAAVDGLDRDAVLVAQSVVVLGDECEVVREGLHADTEVLVVAVDCGPVGGLSSHPGAAHPGKDRADDVFAEGKQGGDRAGRLGWYLVAAGAAGLSTRCLPRSLRRSYAA